MQNSKNFSKGAGIGIAIGIFAVVIVLMIFVCFPLQYRLGMTGLFLTELIFLAVSLLVCLIFRQKFSEVFKISRPKLRHVFGTLILWAGMILITSCIAVITMYLFPDFQQTAEGLTEFISQTPAILTVIIVAVMPAICEEALHRGVILHFFGKIKSTWLIVLIMGIIFGIFHLDPYRFLITALLGGAITYIAVKTHNILLCSLFHFVNNLPAAITSAFAQNITSNELTDLNMMFINPGSRMIEVGGVMLLTAAAPLLLLAGSVLLSEKDDIKKGLNVKIAVFVSLSALMIIVGIWLIVIGFLISARVFLPRLIY